MNARAEAPRVPAHDLDAEGVVLSAALCVPESLPMLRLLVQPRDCYATANADILAACYELMDEGRGVDMVMVARRLKDTGRLERVGGAPYIAQVADATPALANVEEHARRVVIMAQLRAAEQFGGWVRAEARTAGDNAPAFLQQVAERALEVTSLDRLDRRSTCSLVRDDMAAVMLEVRREERAGLVGIATGYKDLDRMCGGLPVGLHFVYGRAGMGKTSFMTGIARNVSSNGIGVAYFSLEMPRHQIITRLISAESHVWHEQIERAEIREKDWPAVERAAVQVARLPLWIDDSARTTVPELRAKIHMARAALQQVGVELGLVEVDYLQLMGGDPRASREERVAENSKNLVEVAKNFNLPVLVSSATNRDSEGRNVPANRRRPTLADARESGQIEQDGSRIFAVYRDEYYDSETIDKGIAELWVLKCRQGGHTGCVKVAANPYTMTYHDLCRDRDPDEPPPRPRQAPLF